MAPLFFASLLAAMGIGGCYRGQVGEPTTNKKAWECFDSGAYDTALNIFTSVAKNHPESNDEHLHAIFGLANVWCLRRPGQDEAKARAFYERLVREAPEHDLAAWSLLGLARMSHLNMLAQRVAPAETLAAYQRVIDRFPAHPAAEEAFIFQQSTLIASFQKEDARRALESLKTFIESHPDSRFTSEAYGWLGAAYGVLDDSERQLAATITKFETREIDPRSPSPVNAWLYWNLATLAEFQAGDFAVARKYYRLLIAEYPIEQRVFPAKQALARMDKMEAQFRDQAPVQTKQP